MKSINKLILFIIILAISLFILILLTLVNLPKETSSPILNQPEHLTTSNLLAIDSTTKQNMDTITTTNIEHLSIEYDEGILFFQRYLQYGEYRLQSDTSSLHPIIIPNESYTLYIFISPTQSLYSINPITLHITLLSKNEVQTSDTASSIMWASNPILHKNNTVAFMSDRREKGVSDIWFYEFDTNSEYLFLEESIAISWFDDSLIYYDIINNSLNSFNTVHLQLVTLFQEVEHFFSLSRNWIVFTLTNKEEKFFFNNGTRELIQLMPETNEIMYDNFDLSKNEQFVFGSGFTTFEDITTLFYYIFDLITADYFKFSEKNKIEYDLCQQQLLLHETKIKDGLGSICEVSILLNKNN